MPEFKLPLDEDPKLADRLKMYRAALDSAPDFAQPADPREKPIPDVDYEEDGFPAMPEDMTAITSRQLGQLMQATESWHEYLNSMLAEYDATASTLKEIKDLAKSHIKDELKEAGVSKADRDEEFRLDARFVQANSDYLAAKNFKDRLDAVKNRLSKRFTLVSREISRRTDDFEKSTMNPDSRFQGRKHQENNNGRGTGSGRDFTGRKLG